MEFNYIDLILNSDFSIKDFTPSIINQYSTNNKIRIVFTDPDFKPLRLMVVVNNGTNLPARSIFLSDKTLTLNDKEIFYYEYPMSQYDTEKFVSSLKMSIYGYDENNTKIDVVSIELPMERADFAKISPLSLEDVNTVDGLIEKTNDIQNQFNKFTSSGDSEVDYRIRIHNTDPEAHAVLQAKINSAVENVNTTIAEAKTEIYARADELEEKVKDASNITKGTIAKGRLPEDVAYTSKNNNFATSQTIAGNLVVTGDIVQRGTSYITEVEQVYSKSDYIVLRDGNNSGLADDEYAGLSFNKYDGSNSGRVVIDNKGILRVGDLGSEQPLATREEIPTNNGFAKWNENTLRFETDTDVATKTELNNKVDKVFGKGLSSNDYTINERNKLLGIEEGAEKNVQSDWNVSATSEDSYILNKPKALPNPYELTLKLNGDLIGTYNGESAKTINIQTKLFEQEQSNWNETDPLAVSYIRNKPSTLANPFSLIIRTDDEATVYDGTTAKSVFIPLPKQSDWDSTDTESLQFIKNKPNPVDNLTSTSTKDYLTANQGRILKDILDSKAAAVVFDTVAAMITALNAVSDRTKYSPGYNFYIKEKEVPDFWISEISENYIEYTDSAANLVQTIKTAQEVQIGYIKIMELETNKVDLTNYVKDSRTINGYDLTADITLNASDVNAYSKEESNEIFARKLEASQITSNDKFVKVNTDTDGNVIISSEGIETTDPFTHMDVDGKKRPTAIGDPTDSSNILSYDTIYNAITTLWEV